MSEELETQEEQYGPLDDVRYEGYVLRDISVEDIYEAENMRTGALNISNLMNGIRQRGLLHPVAVRQTPQGAHHELPYELIAGHRRLASYRALGLERIPAIVIDASDEEVLAARVTENIQREDANAIDEARAMQQMIQLFGWTQTRVARELGVVPSQVSKRLSLLSLPDRVIQMVADNELTGSHAEELTSLSTPKAQEELAEIAVRSKANVQQLKKYVRKVQEDERAHQERLEAGEQAADEQPQVAISVPDQDTPLDIATPDLSTPLPYLDVRGRRITEGMRQRRLLYVLLRAANDVEALMHLEAVDGVTRRSLWAWVMRQPQPEIERLIEVMVTRWFMAAHRFPTFPADLIASLGEVTDTAKDPLWGMPGYEDVLPPDGA
jgi:ParB family chromosome partitioning protein